MKTNDLKKGAKVILNNGWKATIMDNKKGNTRLAEVQGIYTEIGSIYAHDINSYFNENARLYYNDIELTPDQLRLQNELNLMGF